MGRILFAFLLVAAFVAGGTPASADDWGKDLRRKVVPPATERAIPQARATSLAARLFPFQVPQVEWIPATPFNYDRGRGAPVQYIVIHYTAISYEKTIRTFQSPSSRVSAHYVVRGDGHIVQMVGEDSNAWHAGHAWFNRRSVGIEIELDFEGRGNRAFTPEQYYATAALACAVSARHGIPLDRAHVLGHNEIPRTGKIDPGPTWGWPHFMWLTSLCATPPSAMLRAAFVSQSDYPEIPAGGTAEVAVVLRNTGTMAWRKGTSTEARLGLPGNDRTLSFLSDGWPTPDRPAVQTEEVVPPGGTATFTFAVRGAQPGTFTLRLRPVVDGVTWLDDIGIFAIVNVKAEAVRP